MVHLPQFEENFFLTHNRSYKIRMRIRKAIYCVLVVFNKDRNHKYKILFN
jgi:hypothetical protein